MSELKITGIKIENYCKIDLLEIKPEGIVTVKGKNGAGKSTVLDAIYYTIVGGKSVEQPIKKGSKKATIELTLEGKNRKLELTRTITPKSNTLKLVDNGIKKAKAGDILKSLLNKVSIDPQKFLELPKKEQVELMAKVCKVKFDFEKELANHNADVELRKNSKRRITETETRLKSVDLPANIPTELPDMSEVAFELQTAVSFNAKLESTKIHVENIKKEGNIALGRYKEIRAELEAMDDIEEPKDITAIQSKMQYAELAGKVQIKNDYESELKTEKNNLKKIENEIDKRKNRKEKALAEAKIPIKGLITDGQGLILNDIPFEQASTAERIKVSTLLAITANKDLKLINIKDATLLDKDSLQAVVDVAVENDCQLFMEVVSDDEDVVIEFSDSVVKKKKDKLDVVDASESLTNEEELSPEFLKETLVVESREPEPKPTGILENIRASQAESDVKVFDEPETDNETDFLNDLESL